MPHPDVLQAPLSHAPQRFDDASLAPPPGARRLRWLVGALIRLFFRRVEVAGIENIPTGRGGILVAWHPNGLVDPALILSAFPGSVAFGARAGLFKFPLLGPLIAALGSVPIHRRKDSADGGLDEEQRRRNEASLDALAERIARGSFSALFPEGVSHDSSSLKELKTGAARLYYRARSLAHPGAPQPVVVPVGLHYDQKRLFRSRALVEFHPPLILPPELDVTPALDGDPELPRKLARGLTALIERELGAVVLETESWKFHELMHRARKLVRAERASRAGASPGPPTMEEKVIGLTRVWIGYRERLGTRPAEVAALMKRIARYDRDLRALEVEDHELDHPPLVIRPGLWVILISQLISVFLLLPPFLLLGYVVNLPTAWGVAFLARRFGREGKDFATLKLIAGVVLFPLTWAFWSWLAAWISTHPRTQAVAPWLPDRPLLAAALMLPLSIAAGMVMLLYVELARGTWRALRVRFTRGVRARSLLRLRAERARLCDAVLELAEGLDLPGEVGADGSIVRRGSPKRG
jgi:1-acyl-sn-glycerol-3-phosphate acyltransferase